MPESLRDLQSRARKLAALATDESTTDNERANSAQALLRLLKLHPDIIPSGVSRESSEEDDEDDEDDAFVDKFIGGVEKLFTRLDMRDKCVNCGKPAAQLRYGKCAACIYGVSYGR